jgi:sortase A
LKNGAGHFYGSSLPVGGESTHAVITAHSGLVKDRMFTNLDTISKGDYLTVKSVGETLWYQVIDINKVLPEEIDLLKIQEGMDLMTFVTCTPIPVNTHRLLVTGERVDPPADAQSFQEMYARAIPGFPWWAVQWLVAIAFTFIVARFVMLPHWQRPAVGWERT